MLNGINIPGLSGFSSIFTSDIEMFFYIFCFIALHMILINLFYGAKRTAKTRGFKVKRTLIIVMAVAEIVIFANLLSRDNLFNTMNTTTNGIYQKAHVHSGYAN